MKQVLALVGPKGVGKSTIGHLLASELGLLFVQVEPLFLELRAELGVSHPQFEERGFQAVVDTVREALEHSETVCLETTGASAHVPWLLSELNGMAQVVLVGVRATPEQCIARIAVRDASVHIPVSDDEVVRINAIARHLTLPLTAELDNRGPLDPDAIVAKVRSLFR